MGSSPRSRPQSGFNLDAREGKILTGEEIWVQRYAEGGGFNLDAREGKILTLFVLIVLSFTLVVSISTREKGRF